MDSATEELRRQHVKTLEALQRFADENARLLDENAQLRDGTPADDSAALQESMLRLDAQSAAGAAAAARDLGDAWQKLRTTEALVATVRARNKELEATLADERANAADAVADVEARCSKESARASRTSATASAAIQRLEADRTEATTTAERFRAAAALHRDARERDAALAAASAAGFETEKATLADRLRALTRERFVVGKRECELAARLAEAEAAAAPQPPTSPARVAAAVQTDALPAAPPPTTEFGGYVDLKRENARLTRELAELRRAHVALLESSTHAPRFTGKPQIRMRASKLDVFS